jgi:Tol biopolymer transport system component
VWKLAVGGGTPVQLTDGFAAYPAVSPDGKWVACLRPETEPGKKQLQLLIIPFEGGPPSKTINLPPTATYIPHKLYWSPDGRVVTFVNIVNNILNVWSQPIDGGPPKQITNFNSPLWLYNYAPSPDGKLIAAARGNEFSDIVLIKDFR